MEEIWRDIPQYEGLYQISNFGYIVSLIREKKKPKALRLGSGGYLMTTLHKNGKRKTFTVHKLMAITFLNHIPNGNTMVVNHKDFNKKNNSIENLEIVTNRENSNRLHLNSSSRYVGVDYHKKDKKWRARIEINRKSIYLGKYDSEIEAKNAYELKLIEVSNQKMQNI
jgi:hypothetical protein